LRLFENLIGRTVAIVIRKIIITNIAKGYKRGIFKLEEIKGGDVSNYMNPKLIIELD